MMYVTHYCPHGTTVVSNVVVMPLETGNETISPDGILKGAYSSNNENVQSHWSWEFRPLAE